ncbi:MAG: regulatory protein RecX [Gammaproteobacteria bacterium]|nr:regulatory protein RecX [Gammaproteobacteria bacterium]
MMRGKTACELTEAEVRDLAVGYLSRREYAIEELRRKLLQRGIDAGVAEQVIGELVDENLVSDQRFAEMYVRTRIRRLFGPLKIRGELRSRGISDHLIAESLPSGQETWFDSALQWASKRHRGELDYASRAKIYRSLMNRGFTHEQANVALDSLT